MKKIKLQNPISVTDYIGIINQLISNVDAKIVGEVSEVKKAASGHVYFSLKDGKTGDIINCALWKSVYHMCGVKIENGLEVVVSGNADIYGPRGSFTFKIKTIELVGEGALRKAYEELKEKLSKKGFFSQERKREIPRFPQKIGVITSIKGAVIHDFINNLGKFGFKIYICNSKVEGQEAVEDLLNSIKIMKSKEIDVLVIIRGGGSMQSLLAFDNEILVEEIVNFPCPVISGIGHHEDISLAGLASDAHHSTPTAVANEVSRGFYEAKDAVSLLAKKIEQRYERKISLTKERLSSENETIKIKFNNILKNYNQKEERIRGNILSFSHHINKKIEKIEIDKKNILQRFSVNIKNYKEKINNYQKIIATNNPKRQLKMGYAIIKKDNNVLRSIKDLKEEDILNATLYDGKIKTKIIKINKK